MSISERIPPGTRVFETVREFLKTLKNRVPTGGSIEEPKLFVSPNGHLIATLGKASRTLNIRFAPDVNFVLKHPKLGTIKGSGLKEAIALVVDNFQTI